MSAIKIELTVDEGFLRDAHEDDVVLFLGRDAYEAAQALLEERDALADS